MIPLDDTTFAENPGRIQLDKEKLNLYEKNFEGCFGLFAKLILSLFRVPGEIAEIEEHANKGDCNAAVVVNLDPLIVSAFSDELDAVALLRFSNRERADYELGIGTMLVTANKYYREVDPTHAVDITMGPSNHGRWKNFHPIILNFIVSDSNRLEEIYSCIPESQWQRCLELGMQKFEQFPHLLRKGSPFLSTKAYIPEGPKRMSPVVPR